VELAVVDVDVLEVEALGHQALPARADRGIGAGRPVIA
jgi:hypothetical protein